MNKKKTANLSNNSTKTLNVPINLNHPMLLIERIIDIQEWTKFALSSRKKDPRGARIDIKGLEINNFYNF